PFRRVKGVRISTKMIMPPRFFEPQLPRMWGSLYGLQKRSHPKTVQNLLRTIGGVVVDHNYFNILCCRRGRQRRKGSIDIIFFIPSRNYNTDQGVFRTETSQIGSKLLDLGIS